MSSSERRFSLTLSEDDLRPHMRKPKPKPEEPRRNPTPKPTVDSEIEALRLKFEKREEVKKEVKRRVEEEEKERERRRKEEEMRKETEDLWRRSEQKKDRNELPRLGRRFNDSQYFKWDSVDEIPAIPEESVPRPSSRRDFSPIPTSSSEICELCTLARRAIDKSGALVVPTKSAACAHVDAFVAHHQRNHF